MSINVEMSWSQFEEFFGNSVVVRRFSKPAQKAIFKHIEKLQAESDEAVHFNSVFVSATERTSAEVYKASEKAIDKLSGPLLDLLLDTPDVAEKADIPCDPEHLDYDENRTDGSYLEEHYDLLMNSTAYLDKAIPYINDVLDHPYTKLSNGKWLAFNTIHETHAKEA